MPLPVAGAYAWYDATVGVTDAGAGAVSAWADQSGNGRNLSQGTAGSRPITGTRTINGRNCLDFDGADDQLVSANLTQAVPFTIFAVFFSDLTTGVNLLVLDLGLNGPEFGQNNTPRWFAYGGSAIVELGTVVPDNTSPHLFSGIFNGASSNFLLDRVSQSTGNAGSTGLSADKIAIGGNGIDATQCFNGRIGEIVIYASSLSTADRQSTEDYLVNNWALDAPLAVPLLSRATRRMDSPLYRM